MFVIAKPQDVSPMRVSLEVNSHDDTDVDILVNGIRVAYFSTSTRYSCRR